MFITDKLEAASVGTDGCVPSSEYEEYRWERFFTKKSHLPRILEFSESTVTSAVL
jgi:hypothetical protein